MRELKFRVWSVDNKQFVKSIYHAHTECYICISAMFGNPVIFSQYGEEVELHETKYIIQQYTGLKDKNGKGVYEGDIVKINRCYIRPFVNEKQQIDYKFIDDGEVEVGQVLWGWNTQKYLVSYEHIRHDDIEDFDKPSHRVEVIGNIFENPELLK